MGNLAQVVQRGMREKIREIYVDLNGTNWEEARPLLSRITGLNEKQIAAVAAWSSDTLNQKRDCSDGNVCKTVYEAIFYFDMPENVRRIYSQSSQGSWPSKRNTLSKIYDTSERAISSMAAWHTIHKNRR